MEMQDGQEVKKLLIIDDEQAIVQIVQTFFEDKDYIVLGAENAEKATKMLSDDIDIILLDIMMPGIDGISFCLQVRERVRCPIVFLSAKIEEASKIKSLSVGGDDYITKPFSIKELHARVEAHLRRESRPRNDFIRLQFGALWIDYGRKEIGLENNAISFTKKEYLIIEFLSSNAGQVFSQDRIYEKVWGYDADGDANASVMEYIKRIRKKLQAYSDNEFIETVWGIGYRWKK